MSMRLAVLGANSAEETGSSRFACPAKTMKPVWLIRPGFVHHREGSLGLVRTCSWPRPKQTVPPYEARLHERRASLSPPYKTFLHFAARVASTVWLHHSCTRTAFLSSLSMMGFKWHTGVVVNSTSKLSPTVLPFLGPFGAKTGAAKF